MKPLKIISSPETNSWLTPNWALGFLLFIHCFMGTYHTGVKSANIDFFTWWAIPHGIAREYVQIPYSDEDRKQLADKIQEEIKTTGKPNVEPQTLKTVLTFYNDRIIATASPFFYTFLNNFVSDDYQIDKKKFIIVSLLCFTLTFFLLGRLLNYSYLTLFIVYSLISVSFSPYLTEVKVGNINQIQLLLISLFIFSSVKNKGFNGSFWAAFFLGISILLKPNTFFILLFAFISATFYKDIKKLIAYCAGISLSVVIAILATALYFKTLHLQAWISWFKTLPTTTSGDFSLTSGNYSLSKLIHVQIGLNISVFLYIILVSLFIWILYTMNRSVQKSSIKMLSALKKEREFKEVFLVAGFGILTMILSSNLVWGHYYLATIPIYLFFLRPQTENNSVSSMYFLTKPLIYLNLILLCPLVTTQLSAKLCALTLNTSAFILLTLLVIETMKEK